MELNMSKIYISCLFAVATMGLAKGQSSFEIEQFKLQEVAHESGNAALLNTLNFQNIGESSLYFQHSKGDFKHPLLAKESNHYGFSSERYQTLNKWKVYGRFGVDMGKELNVPHTTQLNPLRINPYIIVDSLSGDWNKQSYAIETKIASPVYNDRVGVGLGLKYGVATGARQRDPRPQNTNNELELTPSVIYQLNAKNTLGLTGQYRYFVEDFNVSNINTTTVHNMYKLIGVGEYVGSSPIFISTGGITRKYIGNKFGGSLQYAYTTDNFKVLAEGYTHVNNEEATDGSANPQNAGKHHYIQYGVNLATVYGHDALLHRLSLAWDQKDIDNTESHQYQDATTRQYVTLFSEVFNTNLVTTATLNYQLGKSKDAMPNWTTGIGVTYDGWDNRYSANQSQQTIDRLTVAANFKKYFNFSNLSGLSILVEPGYSNAFSSKFAYDEKAYSTNFVAKNILYPTNAFLDMDYWSIHSAIQYNFKKSANSSTQLYVKISETSLLPTESNTYYNTKQSRFVGQIALGFLSF